MIYLLCDTFINFEHDLSDINFNCKLEKILIENGYLLIVSQFVKSIPNFKIIYQMLTNNNKTMFISSASQWDKGWCLIKLDRSVNYDHYYQVNINNEITRHKLKLMCIRPINGLANRIRFLVSSIALSKIYEFSCYLYWDHSDGFDSTIFNNLFDDDFIKIHDIIQIDHTQFKILTHHAILLENKIPGIYNGIQVDNYHPEINVQDIVNQSIISMTGSNYLPYVFAQHSTTTNTADEINQNSLNIISQLKPNDDLELSLTLKFCYGFHIRRGEHHNFGLSKTSYFIDIARSILRHEPLAQIYLSTNHLETLQYFQKLFPDQIICYPKKFLENVDWSFSYLKNPRPQNSSLEAINDLWLLSRCKMIFGTFDSSFSQIAAMWGNKSLQIVQDFKYYHLYNHFVSGWSLVTCCMNRDTNLLPNLLSWLNCSWIDEIIVIDWSSNNPIRDIVKNEKIKYFRVNGQTSWKLTWAFNLAISLAKYDKIIKFDCDINIKPEFYTINQNFAELSNNSFYTGDWKTSKQPYLNGQLIINKLDFMKINGYNENIIDYGYDDTDLYIRLNKAGLNHIIFKDTDTSNQSVIYHKDHSDNDRAINCTNKNIKATLINNQQVAETHPWYKTQVKHMYLIDNDQITIV